MKDVALLILDMQDAFLERVPRKRELLKRCCFAIEASKLLGIKLIYTEQAPDRLKETNRALIDIGLSDAKFFQKKTFSAFGTLGFTEFIKENDINHLLVAGIETSICVYQTVMDAVFHDLDITVLSDCTAGRREEDSDAIIVSLQNLRCHRLPSETVFFSMLRTSEDPRFKQFSDIVKKYN